MKSHLHTNLSISKDPIKHKAGKNQNSKLGGLSLREVEVSQEQLNLYISEKQAAEDSKEMIPELNLYINDPNESDRKPDFPLA